MTLRNYFETRKGAKISNANKAHLVGLAAAHLQAAAHLKALADENNIDLTPPEGVLGGLTGDIGNPQIGNGQPAPDGTGMRGHVPPTIRMANGMNAEVRG